LNLEVNEPDMKARDGCKLSADERKRSEVFGMRTLLRVKPSLALRVLLFASLLFVQLQIFGQAVTGTVIGTVKDKSGALVPQAEIKLTDTLTKVEHTAKSNGTGYFTFAGIPPSTAYTVVVTAPGFDPWRSQPFAVRPGDQIPISDIRLMVGTSTTEVTVEAITPNMKPLDSPEHSDVITGEELQTLPILGRDAGELMRMLPGFATLPSGVSNQVAYNDAVVGLSGPSGSFSANGTGPNGIATVLDGVSITDIGSNGGTIMNLNVDMVSEVKVTTSTFGADNSKGPAIINAIGKSGTSAYHGMAYFFARDTALNSNTWYNNFLRQPRPDGRYFYPGGMIGGPVRLPFTDFNHNRDKLFFFVGYEYSNQLFSPATLGSWVPTTAERRGDFGESSLNSELCGARPDGVANPNAIQPMCQTENFLPNGAETANGNIAGLGNSSGMALLNWLPLPNANPFTNESGFNYIKEVLQTQNGSQLHAKVDYHVNDSNVLSIGYYLQRQISEVPVNFGNFSGAVLYPGDATNGDISNVMFLNYVHNFGPRVTNELNLGMSLVSSPGNLGRPAAVDRFDMNSFNCNDAAQRASGTCTSGNGNYNYFGVYKASGDYSVPALQGNGQNGYPNLSMPGGFYANHVRMKKTTPDVANNLSWQRGRHLIKVGFYFEDRILNGLADYGAYPQGALTFNPNSEYYEYSNSVIGAATQYTGCESSDPAGNARLSGAAYLGSCMNPNALMYLGYADTFQQTNFSPVVDMAAHTIAGYAMDSWHLKRLTLNLGLRLEHIGAWSDRHGNGLATFSPALYTEQCGASRNCASQAEPGVTWHGIDKAVSNSVNSPATVWPSPRVGLAWDLLGNGSSVIRGGWGIYRSYEEFNPYAQAAATAQGYKSTYLQGQLSLDTIEDQAPTNPPDFSVYTISATDSTRPIFYQYNLTFDQAITWRPLRSELEISYVGADGRNLDSGYNSAASLNNIAPGKLFNANLGSIPTSVTLGVQPSDIGSLTTAETDYFRPYPFYSGVYQLRHDFYSSYNSGQIQWNGTATLARSAGIKADFGANYTFSKNLGVATGYTPDPFNLRNDYNAVPYDRTHVFNVHYLVDLGSHHHFGFAPLQPVLNGWQISGISSILSGQNLASNQGENFGFGYGQIQPVQVPYQNQVNPSTILPVCVNTYHIPADANGNHFCVTSLNSTIWLGTPDIALAPTLYCDPAGGPARNQYINPLCYGIPLPGQNGNLRSPYIHGPALYSNDLTVLKNFKVREKDNLQFRLAAFNFLNHPLTSFNPNNTGSDLSLQQQNGTAGQRLKTSDLTEPGFGIAEIRQGNRLVELSAKYTF
jgi:hypothetical protein